MKYYIKGLLLLGVILVAAGLVAFKMNNKLAYSRNELVKLQEQARSKKVIYKTIEHKVAQSGDYSSVIDGFLEKWKPFCEKSTDAPRVLNDIVGLSFKNTVAVSEKSAQRSRYGIAEGSQESILISLKVIGKFDRIYSWLGEVEEAYPQALVTELELASENKNAALKLKLEIPIVI